MSVCLLFLTYYPSDPQSEPDMLNSAADCLLTCVEFGGDFRRILDDVLGERRLEETVAIMRVVVKSLAYVQIRSARHIML